MIQIRSKTCEWDSTGYNYNTGCGHTYFSYCSPSFQPDIKYDEDCNNICPYCGKIITFKEDEDNG